jgi:hypothetical protein
VEHREEANEREKADELAYCPENVFKPSNRKGKLKQREVDFLN